MPGERRSEEEIRRDIASEREHLVSALADLRGGIYAKRRPAALLVGALAGLLLTVIALRIARRLSGA